MTHIGAGVRSQCSRSSGSVSDSGDQRGGRPGIRENVEDVFHGIQK